MLSLLTQCEVPEASQQLVKAERLCGGWAGPDSLGTGSVSGFGPGGWWLKLSPRCTDLLTCFILEPSYYVWLCVFVCISMPMYVDSGFVWPLVDSRMA